MTANDLSSYIGLIAVFLITANICIGLLIAVRYSPVRYWPHKRINIFRFHQWTAYLAIASVLLHPLVLLLVPKPRFRVFDIILPVRSPMQPLENTIGAVALYLLVIVLITSLLRLSLGRHLWKLTHYLVYPAAAFLFVHAVLTDPDLKNNPVDFFDGEKVFIEVCFLLVVGFSLWALRHRRARERREKAAHLGRYHRIATSAD